MKKQGAEAISRPSASVVATAFLYQSVGVAFASYTAWFWLVSRPLLQCFALHYPSDYPEAEAIALLRRQGFSLGEVPVAFRPRQAGQSSIRVWGSLNFAAKVFLALFVDRLRAVNPHGSAEFIKQGGRS